MRCYIIDRKTFRTKGERTAWPYRIVTESIYEENTDIDVPYIDVNKGDFVYTENKYFGVITKFVHAGDTTSLTCQDGVTLFNRNMFFNGNVTNIERFIAEVINSQYKSPADALYQMPYINVIVESSTDATLSPDIEDGVYNLKSYISKARRRYNIFVIFEVVRGALNVRITRKPVVTSKIDFSDSAYKLLGESYSSDGLGRIDVYCTENGQYTTWYMLADGTVTQTYTPDNRYDGRWESMVIDNAEDVEQKVRDEFLKKSYSHLIEFACLKNFAFFQRIQIRLHGKVLESYISSKAFSSDTEEIFYKSGEMRNKFSDKLKEMI